MQFDAETPFAQAITGYGPDGITISGKRHAGSLLISSNGLLLPWRVQNARGQFEAGDLEAVVNEAVKILPKPYELVILGTGNLQFFPDNQWLAPFIARGLPLEIMSTPRPVERTTSWLQRVGRCLPHCGRGITTRRSPDFRSLRRPCSSVNQLPWHMLFC